MYDKFTEAAKTAMKAANQEAMRVGHQYIGTDDILVGLIEGEADFATRSITSRVTVEQVRQKLATMPKNDGERAESRAKNIIEEAMRTARQFSHLHIGTEHLLLGLVNDAESDASRALRELNFDLEQLKSEIVNQLPPGFPEKIQEQKAIKERFASHPDVQSLKREIEHMRHEMGDAVASKQFDRAVSLRDERLRVEQQLMALYRKLNAS